MKTAIVSIITASISLIIYLLFSFFSDEKIDLGASVGLHSVVRFSDGTLSSITLYKLENNIGTPVQKTSFYVTGEVKSFSVGEVYNFNILLTQKIIFNINGDIISSVFDGNGFDLELDPKTGDVLTLSKIINKESSGFHLALFDGKVSFFSESNIGLVQGHRVQMHIDGITPKNIEYWSNNQKISEVSFDENGNLSFITGLNPPVFSQSINGYYFCKILQSVIRTNFKIKSKNDRYYLELESME